MVDEIVFKQLEEAKPIKDLSTIIRYLEEGKVLLVKQENQGDIVIKLTNNNTTGHKMTYVSRDIKEESSYYKRHWAPYSISINALIAFDVFLAEDVNKYNYTNKFNIKDIVEFVAGENSDVAYVHDVYTDGFKFMYSLSGEERLFEESELRKVSK